MKQSGDELAASLNAETALLPFVPMLLEDLWALGFSPEPALSILARNMPRSPPKVLDLGCGKGALLIHIAQRFGWSGRGVDIMPEFIASARQRARKCDVADLLQFDVEDMMEALESGMKWDLVTFGFDSEFLGPLPAALKQIRKCLSASGDLLLETAWAKPGKRPQGFLTRTQTLSAARNAGFYLVDQELLDEQWVEAQNAGNTDLIRCRAIELAGKFPEHAEAFQSYVRDQEKESRILNESTQCVYLLFNSET